MRKIKGLDMKRLNPYKTLGIYRLKRTLGTRKLHVEERGDVHPCVLVFRDGNKHSRDYYYEIIPLATLNDFNTPEDVEKALAQLPGHTEAWREIAFLGKHPGLTDTICAENRCNCIYHYEYNPDGEILPDVPCSVKIGDNIWADESGES